MGRKIKKTYRFGGGVVLIFVLLAVLFGIYDLNITLSIVHPDNPFGKTLEYMGVLIAPFLAMYSGTVICVYYYKISDMPYRILKLAAGAFVLLAGTCYCCYVYSDLKNIESLVAVILTGILWMVCVIWLLMRTCEELHNLMRIAWTAVVYIAVLLLVINLLKACWGPVSYTHLDVYKRQLHSIDAYKINR